MKILLTNRLFRFSTAAIEGYGLSSRMGGSSQDSLY